MTPNEREMVLKLLVVYPGPNHDNSADGIVRRKEEFVREFRPLVRDRMNLSLGLLEEAYRERNALDVDYAMIVASAFGASSGFRDVLMRLADADWHRRHEDIVSALGRLRDKEAVDVLYRAALKHHEYLAFDDARALAVKAIWALGGISEASAEEKLRLLAQSDEMILREQAMKQLERRAASHRKM
jgi:HEAT repeat protein